MKIFESEFGNSIHRAYLLSDTVYEPFTYWFSDYLYEQIKLITTSSKLPICVDIINTDRQHRQITLDLDILETVLNVSNIETIRTLFDTIDNFVHRESMFVQNNFRLIELLEPGDKKEFERTVHELKQAQSYESSITTELFAPN